MEMRREEEAKKDDGDYTEGWDTGDDDDYVYEEQSEHRGLSSKGREISSLD